MDYLRYPFHFFIVIVNNSSSRSLVKKLVLSSDNAKVQLYSVMTKKYSKEIQKNNKKIFNCFKYSKLRFATHRLSPT